MERKDIEAIVILYLSTNGLGYMVDEMTDELWNKIDDALYESYQRGNEDGHDNERWGRRG